MQLYDPSWVLELARVQFPEDLALHQAILQCTRVVHVCDCGCGTPYFVDPRERAAEDSDFGLQISLHREAGRPVVLDLLPDGRIASIEG